MISFISGKLVVTLCSALTLSELLYNKTATAFFSSLPPNLNYLATVYLIISILFFSCVSSPRYKDVSSPRDKDVYHYIRIKDYDSAVKLIEEQIKSGNEVKRNFALYDKTSLLSEGKGYKKNVDEAKNTKNAN